MWGSLYCVKLKLCFLEAPFLLWAWVRIEQRRKPCGWCKGSRSRCYLKASVVRCAVNTDMMAGSGLWSLSSWPLTLRTSQGLQPCYQTFGSGAIEAVTPQRQQLSIGVSTISVLWCQIHSLKYLLPRFSSDLQLGYWLHTLVVASSDSNADCG